jgi:hypothetical protein
MRSFGAGCLLNLIATLALAQERLPAGTRVGNAISAPLAVVQTYDEGDRRDPFVSLLEPKKTPAPARPPQVISRITDVPLSDVSVRGIVRNGEMTTAVLEGPAGKSFVVRTGDQLHDARIKKIDPNVVIFAHDETDANGAPRSQEVRKSLRQTIEED